MSSNSSSMYTGLRRITGVGGTMMLALAVLTGCPDPEAQERRDVAEQFESAMVSYRQANSGQLTGEASPAELRQQKLEETARVLNAIRGKGTDAQKAATLRVLADVHDATARYHQGLATSAWQQIVQRQREVERQFSTALAANARITAVTFDGSTILDNLRRDQQLLDSTIAELRQRVSRVDGEIRDKQAAMSTIEAQRDERHAVALQLRQQAFVQEGDEQYETSRQATNVLREAEGFENELQREQLQIEVYETEKGALEREMAMYQTRLESVLNAIGTTTQRQSQSQATVQTLRNEAQEASGAVVHQIQQMMEMFSSDVAGELDRAAEEIAQAISLLQQAESAAARDRTIANAIRTDLIAKQLGLVDVHVARAAAYARLGSLLASLQAESPRVMPNQTAAIEQAFNSVRESVEEVIAVAQDAIADGVNQLDQLEQEQAAALREKFDAYRQTLEGTRIEAIVIEGSPAATP